MMSRIAASTWRWAWRLFLGWSRVDLAPVPLRARGRWAVVATAMPAVVRARYVRPVVRLLSARSPSWVVIGRLSPASPYWYRIPSEAAAEHVRLRFDIWPVNVGDHVRIQGSRLTAIGYAGETFCEIIFIQANGEVEPDPHSPHTQRAWAAYRRQSAAQSGRSDSTTNAMAPEPK